MSIIKEFREFFLRNQQVNSGAKADKELGFDTNYIIGNKNVFNRFLKGNYPSESVFKKLFESVTFKLNQEDTAKETEQGLVKLATQTQFDNDLDADVDGFSLQAKITQIKNFINTIIGNRQYTEENLINNGEDITTSLDSLDVALQSTINDLLNVPNLIQAVLPVNSIIMWSGDTNNIPTGWLLCDGNNGTPNLSGKFIVGFDPTGIIDGGDYDTIGNTGGLDAVVLQEVNLPSHSHNIKIQGSSFSTGVNVDVLDVSTTNQLNFDNFSSDDTGNTQGHENRPPFYTLAYIIKQ